MEKYFLKVRYKIRRRGQSFTYKKRRNYKMEQQNKPEQNKQDKQKQPIKTAKKKSALSKEKKMYLYTALSCMAALAAIIVIVVAATNRNAPSTTVNNPSSSSSALDSSVGGTEEEEKPVVTTPEGMVNPIETVAVSNDFGFYHNQTLNSYYEHTGIDFTAPVGTEVRAVEDGKIESIYKDDLLSGTEIVVNHGNGLKTLYRFVTEASGLKVGDTVEKGDVIATVAEANGDEYKDGAHLHFEVIKNEKIVDPAIYLTLEEK